MTKFKVGDRVEHCQLGSGTITKAIQHGFYNVLLDNPPLPGQNNWLSDASLLTLISTTTSQKPAEKIEIGKIYQYKSSTQGTYLDGCIVKAQQEVDPSFHLWKCIIQDGSYANKGLIFPAKNLYNLHTEGKATSISKPNNDGRKLCQWCGGLTKNVATVSSMWQVCPKCELKKGK